MNWNPYYGMGNCGPKAIKALAASLSQYCFEVLNIHTSQFFCFFFPFTYLGVGIIRLLF